MDRLGQVYDTCSAMVYKRASETYDALSPVRRLFSSRRRLTKKALLAEAARDCISARPDSRVLHCAAFIDDSDLVIDLMRYSHRTYFRDEMGYTPLHLAAQRGRRKVAELLIAEGVDVDDRIEAEISNSLEGSTPLHLAVQAGRKEVAELLLTKGADARARSKKANAPLHLAVHSPKHELTARRNQHELTKLLLSHGADIDPKDSEGRTPLHLAAMEGRKGMVKLLLANGASTYATDRGYRTPLDLAELRRRKETARILSEWRG